MRGLVVYESMFGSTRAIAEAIAQGLGTVLDIRVARAVDADARLAGLHLLVVGSPTHAHGMPRPMTRQGAPDYVAKSGKELRLEQGACDPGVREWLSSLGEVHLAGAAFDTRVSGPAALTGRASRGISKSLLEHGIAMAVPPESFLVDKHSRLLSGEVERARAWGCQLAKAVSAGVTASVR